MPCALFGKLPMKRDFISVDAPRGFLQVWEPWLGGGVSSSRIALGSQWRDAFLRAPLWRFWLGAEICGFPVIGSFMSSVDGVGRFFPLTALAFGDAGDAYPPPAVEPQTAWFGDVEQLLLSTLDDGAVYETCLETLAALPLPTRIPSPPPDPMINDLFRATATVAPDPDTMSDAFTALLAEGERRRLASASFWWTIGGDDFRPSAIMADGLPDPNILAPMLSGQFARASG